VEPLIITATPNICWLHPDLDYPVTAEEFAEEAALCRAFSFSVGCQVYQ
jgi:3-keto-5-aminohexanoate cleavage enzyme